MNTVKKIKILQLESFYPQFIGGVYQKISGLRDTKFQNQINYLLESGFSGGHNTVPYLNPQYWESHYIITNCLWSQQQWAKENGLPVDTPNREILVAQLRSIRPDIVYLSDIPGFDFSVLDELSYRPLVVGWHATTLSDHTPWKAFDLVLSGIKKIREGALSKGAQAAAEFMPAAPPYRHLGHGFFKPSSLVFSGSFYGGIHNERTEQFRRLSRGLDKLSLDIYTPNPFEIKSDEKISFHPALYGNDVIRLYAEHAMTLDFRGEFNLEDDRSARETSNMRIFEATRAGSLLLTERSPNLERYFVFGQEIETYSHMDELLEKIHFYAKPKNEAARKKIAEAGLRRVRSEHLIEHRAAWLENILENQFSLSCRIKKNLMAHNEVISKKYSATHAFLLFSNTENLLFSLAQIKKLKLDYPDSDIYLLCFSQECFNATIGINQDTNYFIPPGEIKDFSTTSNSTALDEDDLHAILVAQDHLFHRHESLQRITYIGSDLALTLRLPLEQLADSLMIGKYDFHPYLQNTSESLEILSSGLVSLSRSAGMSILGLLDYDGHHAVDPITTRSLAATASKNGSTVYTVTIDTPWRKSTPSLAGLAWIGPIVFSDKKEWKFQSFNSSPNWESYVIEIYIPYLQNVQSTYTDNSALQGLSDQKPLSSSKLLTEYLAHQTLHPKSSHRILSETEYKAFATEISGWNTPSVAAIQHQAFLTLLKEFRSGRQRADLRALTNIFGRIAGPESSVLEEGCGSGYNSELIRIAAGQDVRYNGIDIAQSMIDLAHTTYPGDSFRVMKSEQLDFKDASFDIVLNGASLMHTIDFENALTEARRVAARYVVLHTVTISEIDRNVYFEKDAYGSRVAEVCFSSRELNQLLDKHHLLPVLMEDSIEYDLAPAIGIPSKSVSIACFCLPSEKRPPNHYCTYFDANYLPRGILLIRSLLLHDPSAVIHVLCLDETTTTALSLILPTISLISLPTLLATDPEFAEARNNRTQIEWYFTATSCLVNYLLNSNPEIESLVYLDADLYFYESPEFLIDEARNSSVQIIEHRFSPHLASLETFGRFNVGWIGFKNSEEGLSVVADYRKKCLEWCFDRLEDDRFGDQKYLEKWPKDFPNCCVSQILGANVAWWNMGKWIPKKFDKRIFVSENLLIFYHFQEIKRSPDGTYSTKKDVTEYGPYYEMIYAPYIEAMNQVDKEIRRLIENFKAKDIRYQSW